MPRAPHSPVRLREVDPLDLPQFFEDMQDMEARHMAAFTPENPGDRDAFMSHWERLLQSETILTRSVLAAGDLAGHIASWIQDDDREITYWLSRSFWGQGIATAALQLFLEGIETRPVFARAALDNAGSIRVLEKCGFVVVAHERGFANARGEEIAEVVMRCDA